MKTPDLNELKLGRVKTTPYLTPNERRKSPSLNTDLWHENARAIEADRIARSNKLHRRLFPWLLLLAILTFTYFLYWLKS